MGFRSIGISFCWAFVLTGFRSTGPKPLRQCGYGVYIGNLFVGCVVYTDDIVLLSVSCFGLEKFMDVCESYSGLWDIKFNPAKSQVVRFGSGNNQFCDIYLNGSVVPVVDKYL